MALSIEPLSTHHRTKRKSTILSGDLAAKRRRKTLSMHGTKWILALHRSGTGRITGQKTVPRKWPIVVVPGPLWSPVGRVGNRAARRVLAVGPVESSTTTSSPCDSQAAAWIGRGGRPLGAFPSAAVATRACRVPLSFIHPRVLPPRRSVPTHPPLRPLHILTNVTPP